MFIQLHPILFSQTCSCRAYKIAKAKPKGAPKAKSTPAPKSSEEPETVPKKKRARGKQTDAAESAPVDPKPKRKARKN